MAPVRDSRPAPTPLFYGVVFGIGLVLCLWALSGAGRASAQETSPEATNPAAPAPTTALTGQVVNGTAGGGSVDGLLVTLQAFKDDAETGRWEATAQPDGTVSFAGLDGTDGLVYLLSAEHLEVRYFSQPFLLAPDPPSEPPVLTVYETTTDASVIKIASDNSVILGPEGTSGTLRAMQVTAFENTSDRAFVGTGAPDTQLSVRLPLPIMAFDLEAVNNPGSLALGSGDEQAVYSVLPVLPGVEEMVVTYRLLYTTDSFGWSKAYAYPIDHVRLLVPVGMSVSLSPRWQDRGPTDVHGTMYNYYEADGGPAGTVYGAQLRGLPMSAGARSRDLEGTLRYAAIGLGALALTGAGGYAAFWATRRRRVGGALAEQAEEDGTEPLRERALERLAWLDGEREAGRLTDEEYATQREEQRRVLRRLMEQGGTS